MVPPWQTKENRQKWRKIKIVNFWRFWRYSFDCHRQTKCAKKNVQPSGESLVLQLSPHGWTFSVAHLVPPWQTKENCQKWRKIKIGNFCDIRLIDMGEPNVLRKMFYHWDKAEKLNFFAGCNCNSFGLPMVIKTKSPILILLSSIFFGHPVLSHWKIWDKRYNLVGQDEVETQVVTEGISWQVRLHLSIRRESSEKAHNSAIAAPVSHCKFNSTNDGESSYSKSVFSNYFVIFTQKWC